MTRTRTVTRDILNCSEVPDFIQVNTGRSKSVESAVRSIFRFLNRLEYKRKKKNGQMCYKLKESNIQKRDEYVMKTVSLEE